MDEIEGIEANGKRGLSRRRLIKLAAYSVPAVAVMNVTSTARVLAMSPICTWTGTWSTNWGTMQLVQAGNQVTGTYVYDNGHITGTVSGNVLTGQWSEAPSYSPPSDAGDFEFVMGENCNSFTGQWRYGSSGGWSGHWYGSREGAW